MPEPLPPIAVVQPRGAVFILKEIPAARWQQMIERARASGNAPLADELERTRAYLDQGLRWWREATQSSGSFAGSAEPRSAELPTDSESPPSLGTNAVALRIKKSPRWVRVLIDREVLRATRVGRTWLIDPDSVDEYLIGERDER